MIKYLNQWNITSIQHLIDRLKAVFTDIFVIILFVFGFTAIFELFGEVSDNVRIIAFCFVFIFYDPIFTSLFGGTLGHITNNLRVQNFDTGRKIKFFSAVFRFLVKASLGVISLLSVSANDDRRAVHDLAVGSVVIYRKTRKDITSS